MLAWQNRRFTILATSITLVTGILGLYGIAQETSSIAWVLVSSLLWFFLGSCAALSWYAGRANAKIAAYIIVFHETESKGWETRLKDFNDKGLDWFSLNRMILSIYVGLGVLSFLVPSTIQDYQFVCDWKAWVLFGCGTWFVFSLFLLMSRPDKQSYEKQWRDA